MKVKSITNIDAVVIWSSNKEISFVDFMKLIYAENEDSDEDCEVKVPQTYNESLNYLLKYCEHRVEFNSGEIIDNLESLIGKSDKYKKDLLTLIERATKGE
jgi:hypothetical protein